MLKHALLAATGALTVGAAFAHHSPSVFDTRSEITIEGTLAKVEWANPHIYLTLEVTQPDGQRVLQQVETVSISAAQSFGLKRELLPLGSKVTVRASPNRRGGSRTALGRDITTSDGTAYPLSDAGRNSRPPVAAVPATSLAGKWAPKANPLLAPTVHGWPLSDRGRAALADLLTGQTRSSPGCGAVPPPMTTMRPLLREIDVRDDRVVMTIDADGTAATRTIRLDLAEHPPNVEPSLLGHSIGRWDGATLVIDTVAFTPHELGIGFGIPSGAGKHLVERLTLTDDRLQLRYELTLEDPEYLAMPATYTALWDHRPELAASAACDRANAELYRQD